MGDSAMKLGKPDLREQAQIHIEEEKQIMQTLQTLLEPFDEDGSGMISPHQILKKSECKKEFDSYLYCLNIYEDDVEQFLESLGATGDDHKISIDAFVDGCMRVKGSATSLDVQELMFEVKLMHRNQTAALSDISQRLSRSGALQ